MMPHDFLSATRWTHPHGESWFAKKFVSGDQNKYSVEIIL